MSLFLHIEAKKFDELREHLDVFASPSIDFFIFLACSVVIATYGLFQNSPAVIIGAMIIAPLMKPLVSLSFGSLTGDTKMLQRASFTVLCGTATGIIISCFIGMVLSFIQLTPEIVERTHPNLLDLGVALFAGAAGAYCQTNKKLYDTLAGVAIAVALVPPLSVVGIGIALNLPEIWNGALLLYVTNLVGITVAGAIVFLVMGYTPLKQARKGLIISSVFLLTLIIPLGFSMYELVLENVLASKIQKLLKETYTFKGVQLQKVKVKRFQKPMNVVATVYNSGLNVNSEQVKLVQEFLSRELNMPVEFMLRIIPYTEVAAVEVSPREKETKLLFDVIPVQSGSVKDTLQAQPQSTDK
jgi:uncharacterized hydrophobic protein (TIGR00271 family)